MILHLNKACYFLDHYCCVFAKDHCQVVAGHLDILSICKQSSRFQGILGGQDGRRARFHASVRTNFDICLIVFFNVLIPVPFQKRHALRQDQVVVPRRKHFVESIQRWFKKVAGAGGPGDGGINDDELAEPFRVLCRHVQRQHAAEGMPAEHYLVESQCIQKPDDVRRMVSHAVAGVGFVAQPAPRRSSARTRRPLFKPA